MKKIIFMVSFCVAIVFPNLVLAGPIIRSGDQISIDSAQILKGDFYGFSPKVTISGNAENDVYIAGGTITVNAPVRQDLTVVGGVVQIHGDVGDDLRVMGGEVTLGKAVKGDVVVLGGSLTILSTASVDGDVLFMGGDLVVEGNVTGAIHGTSDTIRVNSNIDGDILYTATNSFTLGDGARVRGGVTYESQNDIIRAQNAEVTGEIRRTEELGEVSKSTLQFFIFQVGILLFVALVLHLISRKHVQSVVLRAKNSLGMSGLVGLAVFLIIPFVSSILLVSMIGALMGVALLILYFLALILALAITPVMIGLYIEKVLTKKEAITLTTLIIGIVAFVLLSFIPYIGGLLMFAGVIVVLGSISSSLYHFARD